MPSPSSNRAIIVYAGLLMAVGAFSIDITLPFFGRLRDSLQASDAQAHATVTLYIFCLGMGQLVFGPVSDRFGRRPTLVAGLSIYVVGAALALMSTTIEGLLAGRALQGLGGAAGPVMGRAMIRDVSTPPELPKNMALAAAIFALGPILAPLIGVGIATLGGGWRAVFVAMCLYGVGLALAALGARETAPERHPDALNPARLWANARLVLGNPQSRYFIALSSVAMIAIVMVVSGAARIFENEFGVTGFRFAVLFGMHGFGIIAGQALNHRMITRIGTVASALVASVLLCVALGLLALMAALGALGPVSAALLLALFAVGYLIVFSNATSMALEPNPRIAGFCASFFGFATQAVSAVLGTLIVSLTGHSALSWSLSLLAVAIAISAGLAAWIRPR